MEKDFETEKIILVERGCMGLMGGTVYGYIEYCRSFNYMLKLVQVSCHIPSSQHPV
jgi:hypothetical protein